MIVPRGTFAVESGAPAKEICGAPTSAETGAHMFVLLLCSRKKGRGLHRAPGPHGNYGLTSRPWNWRPEQVGLPAHPMICTSASWLIAYLRFGESGTKLRDACGR